MKAALWASSTTRLPRRHAYQKRRQRGEHRRRHHEDGVGLLTAENGRRSRHCAAYFRRMVDARLP
jgi:hypothetical protein